MLLMVKSCFPSEFQPLATMERTDFDYVDNPAVRSVLATNSRCAGAILNSHLELALPVCIRTYFQSSLL